jgi:hypothetical protein
MERSAGLNAEKLFSSKTKFPKLVLNVYFEISTVFPPLNKREKILGDYWFQGEENAILKVWDEHGNIALQNKVLLGARFRSFTKLSEMFYEDAAINF